MATHCSISSAGKESTWNAGGPSSILGSGRSPGEGIGYPAQYFWTSLVAQMEKNLPAMWEAWVRSPGWQDPLEEGMAPRPVFSVFLPGEFYGQRSMAGYSRWGPKELGTTERLSMQHPIDGRRKLTIQAPSVKEVQENIPSRNNNKKQ